MALLSWFLDLVRRQAGGTIETESPKPKYQPRQMSPSGVQFLKQWEGFRSEVYLDAAGLPTIGVGHLIRPGEDYSHGLTYEEGLQLLRHDLEPIEAAVRELVEVPITQNRFDALCSFAFNCGPDLDEDEIPEGLGDSTLLRKLNQCDYDGAAAEFEKWIWAGGRVVPGLVRRRFAERRLFEEGVYAHP